MRILCLGIGSENKKEYRYVGVNSYIPTIYDYDFVILNLPRYKDSPSAYTTIGNKKAEFDKFFENNGVCIVISDELDKWSTFSNYDWCPFADKFEVNNISGETIYYTDKRSKFIFDSVNFTWNHYFTNITISHKVLATNKTNDPISILVPYRKGYCIFLPTPRMEAVNLTRLFEFLLARGLELFPEIKEKMNNGTIPPWANLIATAKELSLLKEYNKISEKLSKYSKFKQLFWESGEPLENLVIDTLSELGLEVIKLPKGSHADFEVKLEGDLVAVCETKGLIGSATLDDLRQLLEYFIDQRDIQKRNVKAIFIVNHFRNEEPSKRGSPATKDAIELIIKYNFKLITTMDLYHLLEKHWTGEITKDYLIKFLTMNL